MEMEENQQQQSQEQKQVDTHVQNTIDYFAKQLAYNNLTEYSGTMNLCFVFNNGAITKMTRDISDNPME